MGKNHGNQGRKTQKMQIPTNQNSHSSLPGGRAHPARISMNVGRVSGGQIRLPSRSFSDNRKTRENDVFEFFKFPVLLSEHFRTNFLNRQRNQLFFEHQAIIKLCPWFKLKLHISRASKLAVNSSHTNVGSDFISTKKCLFFQVTITDPPYALLHILYSFIYATL